MLCLGSLDLDKMYGGALTKDRNKQKEKKENKKK